AGKELDDWGHHDRSRNPIERHEWGIAALYSYRYHGWGHCDLQCVPDSTDQNPASPQSCRSYLGLYALYEFVCCFWFRNDGPYGGGLGPGLAGCFDDMGGSGPDHHPGLGDPAEIPSRNTPCEKQESCWNEYMEIPKGLAHHHIYGSAVLYFLR